mmetsp:Transcript_107297/g.346217  ORF Transcript_107297/g.346217 Transcript_107297/m.346217 type:complete len:321 (+) Transcript_107297:2088-3050(+)
MLAEKLGVEQGLVRTHLLWDKLIKLLGEVHSEHRDTDGKGEQVEHVQFFDGSVRNLLHQLLPCVANGHEQAGSVSTKLSNVAHVLCAVPHCPHGLGQLFVQGSGRVEGLLDALHDVPKAHPAVPLEICLHGFLPRGGDLLPERRFAHEVAGLQPLVRREEAMELLRVLIRQVEPEELGRGDELLEVDLAVVVRVELVEGGDEHHLHLRDGEGAVEAVQDVGEVDDAVYEELAADAASRADGLAGACWVDQVGEEPHCVTLCKVDVEAGLQQLGDSLDLAETKRASPEGVEGVEDVAEFGLGWHHGPGAAARAGRRFLLPP